MAVIADDFTIGVEEEYQIINPETRELRPRAMRMLPKAREDLGDEVTNEFYESQIEIGTPICHTLADVRAELVRLRQGVVEAAQRDGAGSPPPAPIPSRAGKASPSRPRRATLSFKTTSSSSHVKRSSSAATFTSAYPTAKRPSR